MNYLELLEHSFALDAEDPLNAHSPDRREFLSTHVFGFTTYDTSIATFLAQKALEVCLAITSRKTFDYIENPVDYLWFIAMCNMPFFQGRLDWGGSIRGAWWDFSKGSTSLHSCGLYVDGAQVLDLTFNLEEWKEFILSLDAFANAAPHDAQAVI